MSGQERIPVPVNGHGRLPGDEGPTGEAAPPVDADPTQGADAAAPRGIPPGVAAGTDLRIAVSPAQVATGFAVIAGIIALVIGARRRRRGR